MNDKGYLIKLPALGGPRLIPCHLGPVDFEMLQVLVDGYVEPLRPKNLLSRRKDPLTLLVNEEGRLRRLPANPLASMFAGIGIVGDAVLVYMGQDDFEAIPEEKAKDLLAQVLGK